MPKDYKIFNVKGNAQLAECLKHEETEGYELMDIIWCGNLQPPPEAVPGMLVGLQGAQHQVAIIHLFMVVFVRASAPDNRNVVDKAMGKGKLALS